VKRGETEGDGVDGVGHGRSCPSRSAGRHETMRDDRDRCRMAHNLATQIGIELLPTDKAHHGSGARLEVDAASGRTFEASVLPTGSASWCYVTECSHVYASA
jgi:hypothetical protein